MLQGEVSVQDPGEVCSESEAKPSMPALAEQEDVLQGVVQKGHWESRCSVQALGTWIVCLLSLLQEVFSSFRGKLGLCSLVSRCPIIFFWSI